jgi:hypothetical protein
MSDLTAEKMTWNGIYFWNHDPETKLRYLGHNWSGNGHWHQFALKEDGDRKVWCEVTSEDLRLLQEEKQERYVFQAEVSDWLIHCFGDEIACDKRERNHRFIEEALELVQACGGTAEDCHMLVDYVFGRETGVPEQEVGGVMVTLAALCYANDMHMDDCATTELARIWQKVEQIREKQKTKPRNSPLPISEEAKDG